MTYNLKLNFTDSALMRLRDRKIVVVRESREPAPINGACIAWLATHPFQKVSITWEQEFYLYATQTEYRGGAIIDKVSETESSIVDGAYLYKFGKDDIPIFQSESFSAGNRGTFYMKNVCRDVPITAFGLAQRISSGSQTFTNPINVVRSIYNDNIAFTPVEKIRIFTQRDVQNSQVLTDITSDALSLDFTQKTTQEVKYDEVSNRFILM